MLAGSAWTVFDQIVVSGASFATIWLVNHLGSQTQLGLYALALSLMTLLRESHSNVTSAPYGVYCHHRRDPASLASYTGSTLVHQLALTAAAVAMLLLAALVLRPLAAAVGAATAPAGVESVLWTCAAAAPFIFLLKDFRDGALARFQVKAALALDSFVSLAQLLGLGLIVYLGSLIAQTAYLAIGFAAALGCIGWLLFNRPPIRISLAEVCSDWRKNWVFGRWALAGQMLGCTATYAMPWVIAFSHGTAATGVLAACTTLVNLAGTFVTGMGNYLLPKACRTYAHEGLRALCHMLLNSAALFLTTIGAFVLMLVFAGDWIAHAVYRAPVPGAGFILAILALNMLVNSLGMTAGWGLWAIQTPKANFCADACTLTVTLALTFVLVVPWGVDGAALAMLAGTAVGTVVRVAAFLRAVKRLRGEDVTEAHLAREQSQAV